MKTETESPKFERILAVMLDADSESNARQIAHAATTGTPLQKEMEYHRLMLAWFEYIDKQR